MVLYLIKGSIFKTPEGCVFGQHKTIVFSRRGSNSLSEELNNDLEISLCHLLTNAATNGNMVIMGEYVVAVDSALNITGYALIRNNDEVWFFNDYVIQSIENNIKLKYPGTRPQYQFEDLNNEGVHKINVTGHAEEKIFIFK